MDIHFLMLALYTTVALIIGIIGIVLGLKKINGSPFITVFAGFMFLIQIIIIENVTVDYTTERSILVSTIFLQGQDGSSILTTHMNQTQGTQTDILRATIRPFAGEDTRTSSSLIGDTMNQGDFYLSKTGSPVGTMYCGVWDNTAIPTDANYLYLLDTKDVSTLTTSEVKYSFINEDDTYVITTNDAIGCYYAGGSTGNQVNMFYHNADVFDSTNSAHTYYNVQANPDIWSDENTADIKGAVAHNVTVTAEDTQEINSYDTLGNSPINVEFNQYDTWVFTIMLGLMFIFIGIMLQFTKW